MTSSVSILLLDDEPTLRRATALMLSNRGGDVSAAGSPDEAVALSARRLYDVAIFDLSTHGTHGTSASDVLRRIRCGGLVPRRLIAVTTAPLEALEASEFTLVLRKPYAFERLLAAVFGPPGWRRIRAGVFVRVGVLRCGSRGPRLHAGSESVQLRSPSRRRAARAGPGRG